MTKDRDQNTWPFSRQVLTLRQTECICFADSAMIMHVVPELESAEVSSCGLRNISRVAVQLYTAARG